MSDHCRTLISTKPLHFSQSFSPKEIFTSLAHLPWAIWLDSCDSDHIDSRYDIIAWHPEQTVVTQGNTTEITDLTQQITINSYDDPLVLTQHYLDLLSKKYRFSTSNLPFNGGVLGYFSYDLGRRFEQLPQVAERDIALPEMALGLYTNALIFDNKHKQFYLLCQDKKHDDTIQWLEQQIAQQKVSTHFSLRSDWQANITKNEYRNKFDKIQHYLKEGDCYQINLTQRFSADYQGDEFQAYLALRNANQAPFSAFMRLNDAAILSVSPERFLRVQDNIVESKPIKGTLPRSDDESIDKQRALQLRNSVKDRAENLMIVDLLRNDMSKACKPGSVKVPKLFDIESFPAVHHLVSTVVGELQESNTAASLLRAAFPGGSITGAPKIRAMEIIDELEPQRRSVYCGSMGYLSTCGNMDTSITIRTLVCERQQIHCWAGGGIVADSEVNAEYQESLDKVNKILPILKYSA